MIKNQSPIDKNSRDSETEVTALADVFVVTCRQLAYEREMYNIVNLIDFKQGCLLKWLKPPNHKIRLIKSARIAKVASLREPVLPPDRPHLFLAKPLSKRRSRSKKHGMALPLATQQPASTVQSEALPEPAEPEKAVAVPTAAAEPSLVQRPSSTCDLESIAIGREPPTRAASTVRGRTIVYTPSHRQSLQPSPGIRLTKTAVVRQRESHLANTDEQYCLRHPEFSDTVLVKPRSHQSCDSKIQRCMNRPIPCSDTHSSRGRQLPSTSTSSYGHHLPFRRKPVLLDGYIERMFKKSLHCYQHSAHHSAQGKFLGRL